jgi:arylsulfatase A-like enzyme
MYLMNRHFIWLAPLANLLVFIGAGSLLACATKLWPRRSGWFCPRLVCFAAITPALILSNNRIYIEAWAILAAGIVVNLLPLVERHFPPIRRWLVLSFPILLSIDLALAGFVFGDEWLKSQRERDRPMPAADSVNVLLIVLDTVRADRLSVAGYHRRTSPRLEALAEEGIRFQEARATAPWTLPSHASMFTGRLPHELDVDWETPLGTEFATVAEYMGSRGYATAGFAANALYCSYDAGLSRGFTHYEDHVLDASTPFRMTYIGDVTCKAFARWGSALTPSTGSNTALAQRPSSLWRALGTHPHKSAAAINRSFLNWLSERSEPARHFFVFLNYFDAHSPYLLPEGARYPFGRQLRTNLEFAVLDHWVELDKRRLTHHYKALVDDCYDSCIAYLDEQLGTLLAELSRRGVLDRTLVIVTSDHGEELGEHDLFFHGESLYRPEIRVPLLFRLPGHRNSRVVQDPASLRDLPATIVDLIGYGKDTPFPGRSLARFWQDSGKNTGDLADDGVLSELASPNPLDPNQGRSPAHRGPLSALCEGDFVYIRNERDGSEELFNERDDPAEIDNRAQLAGGTATLNRLREKLNKLRRNGQGTAR